MSNEQVLLIADKGRCCIEDLKFIQQNFVQKGILKSDQMGRAITGVEAYIASLLMQLNTLKMEHNTNEFI